MTGLFVTDLWREVYPDNIAAIRDIIAHQTSLPTGGPQSVSG